MVWTKNNKCVSCGKNTSAKPAQNCIKNEHLVQYNKSRTLTSKYHENRRRLAIQGYGGKCFCCGYDNINKKVFGKAVLQIDHVYGGGSKERNHHGERNVEYVIDNRYPSTRRILCAACNAVMEPGEKTCELHKWEDKNGLHKWTEIYGLYNYGQEKQ
jgi:hypothetical protein